MPLLLFTTLKPRAAWHGADGVCCGFGSVLLCVCRVLETWRGLAYPVLCGMSPILEETPV